MNIIVVNKDCTVSIAQLAPETFTEGEEVQPWSPYYWHLIWGGLATDTGVPANEAVADNPPRPLIVKPDGLLDGDGLRYDDTDKVWKPSRAVRSNISRSLDQTWLEFPLAVGTFTIIWPKLTLPPSKEWRTITYGHSIKVTTAGAGLLGVGVADITSGSPVDVGFSWKYDADWAVTPYASLAGWFEGSVDVPPTTSWKTYRMRGAVLRDSGSLTASIANTSLDNGVTHYRQGFMRSQS